jgi:Prealbumin-like fold domain
MALSSAKLTRYRGPATAVLVLAAFTALASIGSAGLSANSSEYGYGYEYEYEQGHLTVIKHVVSDNGGTAGASQFTMTITGVTAQGGNSFPGSEAGTDRIVDPGTYEVTETGPSGYDATFSAGCSGSIAAGQTKTCTVTNDDRPAHLTVIKHVINNDTGAATASDFTMTISGVTAEGGNSFPGSEAGTTKVVTPGAYHVGESGPAGYFTTFSADCDGTIALGGSKTCTVTNNDLGPRRTAGYWKNHDGALAPMLPVALGSYAVSSLARAQAVFDSMNCSSSKPAGAVGCLSGQLLATKLNLANGNSTCIQPTVGKADSFLTGGTVTAGGVTATGIDYTGPSGTYDLSGSQRAVATTLADALDKYNNDKKGCANP